MWSRKRLDIAWTDLIYAAFRCILPPGQAGVQRRLEAAWDEAGGAMACLSVRTGLDLLLSAWCLPAGSEVLMSAITIPDMGRIVERHGLVPVPMDLDPLRMAPTRRSLEQAITPATRAVVLAHLFGGRLEMAPLVDAARQHGLRVIEDCAQAFDGPYCGHPAADASLFSFGTIKSTTALGGALVRVRDPAILARMRASQASYPVQSRVRYLKRLCLAAALKVSCCRLLLGAAVRCCRSRGIDYDRTINRLVRGFPGPDFFARIRHQPSGPLLALLDRRLRRFDPRQAEAQRVKGDLLWKLLRPRVFCPGVYSRPHTYWVFPVLVCDPQHLIAELALAGFDATQGQSLTVIRAPADRRKQRACVAEEILAAMVFLPFYPAMPEREVRRMARVVLDHCGPTFQPREPARLSSTPADSQLTTE